MTGTAPHKSFNLRLPQGILALGPMPLVMGILNVTPDSFSDGGDHADPQSALTQTLKMRDQGADIIDVGGESTRPGHAEIGPQEEMNWVLPVIEHLVTSGIRLPISIDTYKAIVADQAVQSGATIINDVYGLQRDPEIADVAATYDLPTIVMHWDKARDADKDIVAEVRRYFEKSLEIAVTAGIKTDQIVLDPGFGFGKSVAENYLLLRRLPELAALGYPLLIGTSRKRMIGNLLGVGPRDRATGTAAISALAYERGAHIFRVHDVQPNREALKVAHATLYGAPTGLD